MVEWLLNCQEIAVSALDVALTVLLQETHCISFLCVGNTRHYCQSRTPTLTSTFVLSSIMSDRILKFKRWNVLDPVRHHTNVPYSLWLERMPTLECGSESGFGRALCYDLKLLQLMILYASFLILRQILIVVVVVISINCLQDEHQLSVYSQSYCQEEEYKTILLILVKFCHHLRPQNYQSVCEYLEMTP